MSAAVVWFPPSFYEGRFIILWLSLSLYILINVFLLICFCSTYVIPLFGRCSRVLDPALNTSLLNWDIIWSHISYSYSEFSLHLSRSLLVLKCYLKQKFTTLGCYCSVIYCWLFFYFPLLYTCFPFSFGSSGMLYVCVNL